jgi:hypothetical protein
MLLIITIFVTLILYSFLHKKNDNNNVKRKNLNKNFPFESLLCYESPKPKIRLGKNNDGGYILVDGYSYDLMLGCGINDDSSFEHAFLQKYPEVPIYAFDGTIESFPNPHPKIQFINKNISDKNDNTHTNMHQLIKNKKNIFLKMDIEGGEYPWLHSLSTNQLLKFKQIVIEFHEPFVKYKYDILDKLSNTHFLVHIHGNNWAPINNKIKLEDSIIVPDIFECTYIRKDNLNLKLNKVSFPTQIDQRNRPDFDDIELSGFPYTH